MERKRNRPGGLARADLLDLPDGTLRVLQITDTHLYADPSRTLLGINTRDSMHEVLALVDRLQWPFDCILATGDLVHDSSKVGYNYLADVFESLGVPTYCLPGNHDKPEALRRWLVRDGSVMAPDDINIGPWQMILLNSVIPGEDGGRMAHGELERLDATLAANPEQHALVTLHHQPLPVQSAWLDTMCLEDGEAFFEVIDRHPHVRAIVWGHIHQDYSDERNGVPLLATPSTCIQFAPRENQFRIEDVPPGCRLIALLPDGSVRSQVHRLEHQVMGLDIASAGY